MIIMTLILIFNHYFEYARLNTVRCVILEVIYFIILLIFDYSVQ